MRTHCLRMYIDADLLRKHNTSTELAVDSPRVGITNPYVATIVSLLCQSTCFTTSSRINLITRLTSPPALAACTAIFLRHNKHNEISQRERGYQDAVSDTYRRNRLAAYTILLSIGTMEPLTQNPTGKAPCADAS